MESQRDIDRIIDRLSAEHLGVLIEQIKVKYPGADDDGLWFIRMPNQSGEVQLESSYGQCPFLIESDFNNERFWAHSIDDAVATIKRLYALV